MVNQNKNILETFEKNNIFYCWKTLYVGKQLHILTKEDIAFYATEFLIKNPSMINPYIATLAFDAHEKDIDMLLQKTLISLDKKIPKENSVLWNHEKRILRYGFLITIIPLLEEKDYETLDKIALIYEKFDYPEDMEQFIHYHPKSNIRKLVNENTIEMEINWPKFSSNFINFLQKESEALNQKKSTMELL